MKDYEAGAIFCLVWSYESSQFSVCFNLLSQKNLLEICRVVVQSPCTAKPGLVFHSGVRWASKVIIHIMTVDLSA